MYRIRRFGIVKTATTVAVLYMVAIAIFAIPLALLLSAVGSAIPTSARPSIDASAIITFVLLLVVGYGIGTWVFTAIACALYNLVARWVGGVEMLLEAVAPPPPVTTWESSVPPAPSAPPASTPAGRHGAPE